jgi:hypothetical protein
MALAINTQSNAFGVVNMAKGSIVTDAVAAVAQTFTLGFNPRKITIINLTDRISDEWDEGMDLNAIYVNILGITAKLDADAGVIDTNYGALWNPIAVVTGTGGPTSAVPYDVAPQSASSLIQMRASITGILAKLDLDTGVTDTNYTALWNPAVATATAIIASIAGLTAKLDADVLVADINYFTLWGTVPVYMSLHTAAAGTTTLEVVNGINVVGNTFSLTAATMVASKQFYWTAQG